MMTAFIAWLLSPHVSNVEIDTFVPLLFKLNEGMVDAP